MTKSRIALSMSTRAVAMVAASALALAGASATQAQSVHDVTLRSIAPATINGASFDSRANRAVRSIAPSSLENQPSIVPAVYDPFAGRFVSALGNSRGAITVSSTGAVSVLVNNQSSSMVVGGSSAGFPMRSDPVLTPANTLNGPQVISYSGNAR